MMNKTPGMTTALLLKTLIGKVVMVVQLEMVITQITLNSCQGLDSPDI